MWKRDESVKPTHPSATGACGFAGGTRSGRAGDPAP